MEFQLDIYGNLVPIKHIVQEQKCNERYKRKVLNNMKKYLESRGVIVHEKSKRSIVR